ncbi:hypothetical protein BDN72DRAFT_155358 [Pluteus cervinus]|uniref:Uncharacterized protein n=1 Tax=Pluteus cervinus TaxID=181527 RepID=A0ACD3AKY7_9AGAR|nr:hypothetical protein BDN72DRAFT_155358 [Pluteus cervinus]
MRRCLPLIRLILSARYSDNVPGGIWAPVIRAKCLLMGNSVAGLSTVAGNSPQTNGPFRMNGNTDMVTLSTIRNPRDRYSAAASSVGPNLSG